MASKRRDIKLARKGVGLIIHYISNKYPHSRLLCIWFLPVFGDEVVTWDPDFEGDLNT